MGRIFEKRKYKMFARYDRMAKSFTKIGREIALAVKSGGPDPSYNPRLRMAIQNAKGVNMPKDRVEAAIKRAVSKESGTFEEVLYEGYGPHGVAMMMEAVRSLKALGAQPRRTIRIALWSGEEQGLLGSIAYVKQHFGTFEDPKPEYTKFNGYGAPDLRDPQDVGKCNGLRASHLGIARQDSLDREEVYRLLREYYSNTKVDLIAVIKEGIRLLVSILDKNPDVLRVIVEFWCQVPRNKMITEQNHAMQEFMLRTTAIIIQEGSNAESSERGAPSLPLTLSCQSVPALPSTT